MTSTRRYLGLVWVISALLGCATGTRPTRSITFEEEPTPAPNFGCPVVALENLSDETITVSLFGPSSEALVVEPKATRTVTLPPGKYSLIAVAPSVPSYSVADELSLDTRYFWRFRVEPSDFKLLKPIVIEPPKPIVLEAPESIVLEATRLIAIPSEAIIAGSAEEELNPTLTLVNQSSSPALVRLKGPTNLDVEVPAGGQKTVTASGGNYFTKIRFGSSKENYAYFRGESFFVTETETRVSAVTIVFNVISGNYSTQPISEEDFWK